MSKKKKSGKFDTRVDKSNWTEADHRYYDAINEIINRPPEPYVIDLYFDTEGKKKWDEFWENYFKETNQ